MKLISLNIEMNKHTDVILEFIRAENPDVICFQELLEDDFSFYKKEFALDGIFQSCRYSRHSNYPESMGKKIGVAIFAKNIVRSGFMYYVGNGTELLKPFDAVHFKDEEALVWAEIKNTDGIVYTFATAHLPVTHHGESSPFQLQALENFFTKLDTLREFVLAGDMNAPRGNETFNRLAKKYKDNIPLEYKTSIDQNLHRVKGLPYMIDCLFTTPLYRASNVSLMDGVSDHMAVVGEIEKA
jgi:exonuclease III